MTKLDLDMGIVAGILVIMLGYNTFIALRDKKTKIDSIDSRINELDIRTKEIQQNTDKINEYIAVEIYSTMKSMQNEQKGAVKLLVDIHEDVSYRQRLKAEYSRGKLHKRGNKRGKLHKDVYDNTETSE